MNKFILFYLIIINITGVFCSELKKNTSKLFYAILENDLKETEEIIKKFPEAINAVNGNGDTPLLLAIKKDFIDLAKLLINNKADVNAKNIKNGITPLIMAINKNSIELTNLLINSKANINQQENQGVTPLMLAVFNNNIEIAKILLDQKAEINNKSNKGMTALHFIISNNSSHQLADLLIENGADINLKNKNNQTPLDLAFDALRKNANNTNIQDILIIILYIYFSEYYDSINKINTEIHSSNILPKELSDLVGQYNLGFIEFLQAKLEKTLPEDYIKFINNEFIPKIIRSNPRLATFF